MYLCDKNAENYCVPIIHKSLIKAKFHWDQFLVTPS